MSSCLRVSAIKVDKSIIVDIDKIGENVNATLTKLSNTPMVKINNIKQPLNVVCKIIYDINKNGFLIT